MGTHTDRLTNTHTHTHTSQANVGLGRLVEIGVACGGVQPAEKFFGVYIGRLFCFGFGFCFGM